MKPFIFHKKITKTVLMTGVLVLLTAAVVTATPAIKKNALIQAVMCEDISKFKPVNQAVVFSISQGEVFCFSHFDPVPRKTEIFHKWYKKDRLVFTMRLTLSPPKWSSFSRIQIRDADKGPWRVEIRNSKNTLLKTLRFSMVD